MLLDYEVVRSYCEIPDDSDSLEIILEEIESGMLGVLESATGQKFSTAASVVWYGDGGGTSLFLPGVAGTPTLVEVRAGFGSGWETLTGGTWEFDAGELRRVDGGSWPSGHATVRVTYPRGCEDEDALPRDIRLLLLDLINYAYRAGRTLGAEAGSAAQYRSVKGFEEAVARYRGGVYG